MVRRPHQAMAYWVITSTVLFGVLYVHYLVHALQGVLLSSLALGLLVFKTGVEIMASSFGFALLFMAVAYLFISKTRRPTGATAAAPPVGIIYLCCHDLNPVALKSLASLAYRGTLYLLVHDDAVEPEEQARVNAEVERLRQHSSCEIRLLRRPHHEGGKPAALNYVLEQTAHLYNYVLLCDNDSIALDSLTVEKVLPYFADPQVGVVQCRSIGIDSASYGPINRLLRRSIDAFDVEMTVCSRFGWSPFIGHNAFLRTRAVLEVGAFTPGFFSDDLDLTVRLNLRGYRVVYAPEVLIGETHPPSLASFRRRSYKWAYGCVQTLKAHAWTVLTSRRLGLAEKVSFFQFAGFYIGQAILLLYVAVTFVLAPFVLTDYEVSVSQNVVAGIVIIFLIYVPLLSFFAKGRTKGWAGTLLMCGLVYGATDFACAHGIWDCLWNRKRQWIPTNARLTGNGDLALLAEAVFGLLLLGVPLVAAPMLLAMPSAYLFGGKFLFGPALALFYDDHQTAVLAAARRGSAKPSPAVLDGETA